MFSTDELTDARAEFAQLMTHTYTRIPRLAGADDAWGDQSFTPGTAQANRPCRYFERSTVTVDPNGLTNLNVPTLMVPTSDVLGKGDQVSQIQTSDGTLLVGGPIEVEDISPVFPDAGGPIYRRALLRQVQNV